MKKRFSIPRWVWVTAVSLHIGLLMPLVVWTKKGKTKKVSLAKLQTHVYRLEKPKPAPLKVVRPQKAPVKKKPPPPKVVKKTKEVPVKKVQVEAPPPQKKVAAAATPVQKQPLDELPSVTDQGYQQKLLEILSSYLRMPREGYVILEVTVVESGKVVSIKVHEASDQEILNTLKDQIANIRLPPFSHECRGEKEKTFMFKFV